ncbi:hypothetical protein E2C01_081918 [Portunus trituberculatus]|uniref:Uncharacterized protein n=1 Tax=Portunus trituberculatus TaxID=210409 RepID=A0A5B7IXR5_PORTR|nr:hypothetical protein [Portunus trituberculatus]
MSTQVSVNESAQYQSSVDRPSRPSPPPPACPLPSALRPHARHMPARSFTPSLHLYTHITAAAQLPHSRLWQCWSVLWNRRGYTCDLFKVSDVT